MGAQKSRGEKPRRRSEPSLRSVVGDKTYAVWLDMLKTLVPGGRTHRVAPLVAGMLRYASARSTKSRRHRGPSDAVVDALVALEEGDDDAVILVTDAVQQLFRDAGVRATRASRRGEPYSIADAAIHELQHWDAMPWE
jgi:hypothetical protein